MMTLLQLIYDPDIDLLSLTPVNNLFIRGRLRMRIVPEHPFPYLLTYVCSILKAYTTLSNVCYNFNGELTHHRWLFYLLITMRDHYVSYM